MPAKRTSLESLRLVAPKSARQQPPSEPEFPPRGRRPGVKQQTAYLPEPVYEQLRRLAFEERRKMHDYLLEGLDRVFHDRGLKSVAELTGKR
jgi:hypothetical protein